MSTSTRRARSPIATLNKLNGYRVTHVPNMNYEEIVFNCARSPFTDVRVRQAVAYAIDWQVLVQQDLPAVGIALDIHNYPADLYLPATARAVSWRAGNSTSRCTGGHIPIRTLTTRSPLDRATSLRMETTMRTSSTRRWAMAASWTTRLRSDKAAAILCAHPAPHPRRRAVSHHRLAFQLRRGQHRPAEFQAGTGRQRLLELMGMADLGQFSNAKIGFDVRFDATANPKTLPRSWTPTYGYRRSPT